MAVRNPVWQTSKMITRRRALAAVGGRLVRAQGDAGAMFGNAEAYERFMGRWSSVLAPRLVEFARTPEEGRVLDVGSGTGSLAFAAARARPRCEVVGIDPSKEYVGFATQRNSFGGRVRFEVGDAQALRFGNAEFNATLSLLVWNFIPDPRKALGEARRVTKQGGWIAAAVWDYAAGMRMFRVFWSAAGAVDKNLGNRDEAQMPFSRPGELAELWKWGGLTEVEQQPLEFQMRFRSFADYWDPFLLGQGPAGQYVRQLDEERRRALRAEVIRRLGLRNEQAGFELPARAWAARGRVA